MSKEQNFSGPQTAMECQAVQEQLSAWLDGELAGARITAHLERCAACREEWRRLKALGVALGGTMARTFYGGATPDEAGAEVASLEAFHDFPPGSLGAIVASYQPEEGNGDH